MPRRPSAVDVTDAYDRVPQPTAASATPTPTQQLSNTQASATLRGSSVGTTVVGSPRKRFSDAHENGSAHKKARLSNGSSQRKGQEADGEAAEAIDNETYRLEKELLEGEELAEEGDTTKPTRRLDGFKFFHTGYPEAIVSLDDLKKGRGVEISGVGYATPTFTDMNDEDEPDAVPVPIHLDRIRVFQVEYADDGSSYPYVETDCAWYELHTPSPQYKATFNTFYRFHGIAKWIIKNVHRFSSLTDLRQALEQAVDPATGNRFKSGDNFKDDVMPTLMFALARVPEGHTCRNSALLKRFVTKIPCPGGTRFAPAAIPGTISEASSGDLDRDVLKPQNLIMTTVTRSILELVLRFELFREQLYSLGGDSISQEEMRKEGKCRRDLMYNMTTRQMERAREQRTVELQRDQFRQKYLKTVKIIFTPSKTCMNIEPRDVILVPKDGYVSGPGGAQNVDKNKELWDYFRAGVVMHITHTEAHVRWLVHSYSTIQQELSNPHEMFLTDTCDSVQLTNIVSRMTLLFRFIKEEALTPCPACRPQKAGTVRAPDTHDSLQRCCHFHVRLKWNEKEASLTGFDLATLYAPESGSEQSGPNSCPVCISEEAATVDDGHATSLGNRSNDSLIGISRKGEAFHKNDFVLLRGTPVLRGKKRKDISAAEMNRNGLCKIGQIKDIRFDRRSSAWCLTVRLFVRMKEINDLDEDLMYDERHLFLTHLEKEVLMSDIIGKCYIRRVLPTSLSPIDRSLFAWRSESSYHYYAAYKLLPPRTNETRHLAQSWTRCVKIEENEMSQCMTCEAERNQQRAQVSMFNEDRSKTPGGVLRALDLCAGTGSFGLGIAEATEGMVEVTHAVEISPSAARTVKRNVPEVKMYNQCINTILNYVVEAHDGGEKHARPTQHWDGDKEEEDRELVPEPFSPGDIDVLICGLPCQPHSALNAFKKSEDRKSNLLLTVLGFIDFLQAHGSLKYIFMENVEGFISFRLIPEQLDARRVGGGIENGGLKLIYRVLTDRGFQVRMALLQAAHYGVPQSRVRFFLIACKKGLTLPEFPKPTHVFPDVNELHIKTNQGSTIYKPIRVPLDGSAIHPFVTVNDALSDLLKFDWRHPHPEQEKGDFRKLTRSREVLKIKTYNCVVRDDDDNPLPFIGPKGHCAYHSEPRTAYQMTARLMDDDDEGFQVMQQVEQHYTRRLPLWTIRRVLQIPMQGGSDYRSLPASEGQYFHANASSAEGRKGWTGGYYGRLEGDKWFRTIVTNIQPNAKQSKVLHPDCRRIVSVRDLLRSQSFPDDYVIESLYKNVVTMHRQIGNAVPWLLARAIGESFKEAMFQDWKIEQEKALQKR